MVLIDMEMPTVCVDGDWHGSCPLDRLWCAQRFAPKGYTTAKIVADQQDKLPKWCPLKPFTPPEPQITTNIYDTEEIHHGCTVQVLRNSVTGDVSVGWWEEKEEKE